MINVNLLDWRGKIRDINNNKFYALAGVVVFIVVLLSLSVIFVINSMVGGEKANIKYLENEIGQVETKIVKIKDLQKQKDLLISRRAVIETLQASSPFVVRMLDNLAKSVPDGVVIKSLTRTEDQLVITGSSDTNSQVSALMKNIEPLKWVKSYKLNDITTLKSSGAQTSQTNKNAAADDSNAVNNKIDFQLNIVLDSTLSSGKPETGGANAVK